MFWNNCQLCIRYSAVTRIASPQLSPKSIYYLLQGNFSKLLQRRYPFNSRHFSTLVVSSRLHQLVLICIRFDRQIRRTIQLLLEARNRNSSCFVYVYSNLLIIYIDSNSNCAAQFRKLLIYSPFHSIGLSLFFQQRFLCSPPIFALSLLLFSTLAKLRSVEILIRFVECNAENRVENDSREINWRRSSGEVQWLILYRLSFSR